MKGEASIPMGTVDSRAFHVLGELSDPRGERVSATLRAKNPNVLFIVTRSCNLNIVVYEGRIDSKHPTRLDSKAPVDIYWLNLEQKYASVAREKKIPHDRDELSWMERKLAYGAKAKASKSLSGTFALKMNALASLPIQIGIDPKSNRPRAYLELHPNGNKPPGTPEGILCFLERVYVHVIYNKLKVPDVDRIIYYGTSVAENKQIQQQVIR